MKNKVISTEKVLKPKINNLKLIQSDKSCSEIVCSDFLLEKVDETSWAKLLFCNRI